MASAGPAYPSELSRLGLRELRALEMPREAPDDVWLGMAIGDQDAPVALVSSRRTGPELVGWARVAALLAGPEAREVLAFAPVVRPETREAAQRFARGPRIRLISAPSLAVPGEPLFVEELPPDPGPAGFTPARSLFDRVLRVLEGSAVVTDVAGVRRTEQGFVLYVRGIRVVEVAREGEAVRVSVMAPERQRLVVTETNFPRLGPDLHELIVRLAQDPRLIDSRRDDSGAQAAAAGASARIVARWMPWNSIGEDPIDWTGVDDRGRPVLGWMRASFELSDVPAVLSALQRLETEREAWAPGSRGRPRVVVSARQIDPRARALVSTLDADLEGASSEVSAPAPSGEFEPRQPRRGRRRRGRREDFARDPSDFERDEPLAEREPQRIQGLEARLDDELEPEPPEEDELRERQGGATAPPFQGGEFRGLAEADLREGREDLEEVGDDAEDRDETASTVDLELDARAGSDRSPAASLDDPQGRRRRSRGRRGGRGRARRGLRSEEPAAAAPADEMPEPVPAGDQPELDLDDELREDERAALPDRQEPADGLGVEPTLPEEEGAVEEEGGSRPLRRRPRAALCVRNDPDSILAALVLARERRHVSFFYVCGQEQLMDFFRGRATDLEDSADLLLVGFTAQPVPNEVIAAAGLYRGRIEWFDHHSWPIEDQEMLRDAIGRDAITFVEAGASPLAAVMTVAERRSRFTDKLIDLAGRRLSEADMQKWGYRVMGLLHRLAATRGDHRAEILPVLAGRPGDLPDVPDVYASEQSWLEGQDPRIVLFGEHRMAVVRAPAGLDAGELGRRARLQTGARLSLASRDGDDLVLLGCNEEKRHMNVLGLVEQLANEVPWLHVRAGGDRVGRLQIDELASHPERFEHTIGGIVRHKSILYG